MDSIMYIEIFITNLLAQAKNAYFLVDSKNEISDFLKNFINSRQDLEPKADMCSKVFMLLFFVILYNFIKRYCM